MEKVLGVSDAEAAAVRSFSQAPAAACKVVAWRRAREPVRQVLARLPRWTEEVPDCDCHAYTGQGEYRNSTE